MGGGGENLLAGVGFKSVTDSLLDPFQFAYRANRSVFPHSLQ